MTSLGKFTSTCNKDSFQLNARNPGYKYLWNTGDTTQKIWAKKEEWYAVKIYSPKCFVIDSTYLSFAKRLTIEFNTDTVGCEGDTLLLNPGWIFKQIWWNYTDTNHVLKVFNSGIYPLRIFYQGCIIDTFASVNFASPGFLKLPGDTELCAGDTLYISAKVNATKYYWSNGDTTKITKIFTQGKVWLKASFNGCYQSDTMQVAFTKKPVIATAAKVYTCAGLPGTIRITVPAGSVFQWLNGNTNKTRTFSDTGWHVFSLSNPCFTVTDSAYNGYYTRLAADSATTLSVCFEDDTMFTLSAKQSASYLWKPGNLTTQLIIPKKYGWYTVMRSDSGGCSETDSFHIIKKCTPDTLLIPNAFSPNGDGKNDFFKPSFVRHVNYEFRIYDRWGELMFRTNNIYEGWDGKYKATAVPEDVYIYIIEVSGYGIFRQLKGTVNLVR